MRLFSFRMLCPLLVAMLAAVPCRPSAATLFRTPASAVAIRPAPEDTPRPFVVPLQVSTLKVLFEDTPAGATSSVHNVVVANVSEQALNEVYVSLEAAPGVFRMYSNCPATLAPGEACVVMLRFTPGTPGRHLATLRIVEPASSIAVELSGLALEGVTPFQSAR